MSGHDAFEEEMRLGRLHTVPDLDRLLERRVDDADPDLELAEELLAVRHELRTAPDAATATRHMSAIRAAAVELTSTPRSASAVAGPTRRRRLGLGLATAIACLPVLGVGLAFAGVALPGPAGSAFERLGVELPNQAGGDGEAGVPGGDAGASPETLAPDADRGSAGQRASFGDCVSEAAAAGAAHPAYRCRDLHPGAGRANGGGREVANERGGGPAAGSGAGSGESASGNGIGNGVGPDNGVGPGNGVGQTGSAGGRGNSGSAPGQSGSPGASGDAPGQSKENAPSGHGLGQTKESGSKVQGHGKP